MSSRYRTCLELKRSFNFWGILSSQRVFGKLLLKNEQGKLKDQKLNRKQLRASPEFEQHHFQSLHNLDTSFQQNILGKVVEKEMKLSEAVSCFTQ